MCQKLQTTCECYLTKIDELYWPKSWLQFILCFPLVKMKLTVAKSRLHVTLKYIRELG